jgi:Zn-dependent protease
MRALRQSPTPRQSKGSLRIARIAGIDVFVHWSWAIVAAVEISFRSTDFSSPFWNALEYLTLFAIVLAHEFGHALACRSVGGQADTIVLWPLGGIAYVQPPQRPGAMLWSIAAGPLVNVVLVPITIGAMFATKGVVSPDVAQFVRRVAIINGGLLAYNLLPFYPLDGGQIVRSFLWFFVGRARSLMAATALGLVGAVGLGLGALYLRSTWLGVLSAFNAMRSWRGYQSAKVLRSLELAPRHPHATCPTCHEHPPVGSFWGCPCRARFDTFATGGICPSCGRLHIVATCLLCFEQAPLPNWVGPPPPLR